MMNLENLVVTIYLLVSNNNFKQCFSQFYSYIKVTATSYAFSATTQYIL